MPYSARRRTVTTTRRSYRPSYKRYGARKPTRSFRRPVYSKMQGSVTEIKSYDWSDTNSANGLVVDTAAVTGVPADNMFTVGMSCLNLIQQGATFFNRIGSKVLLKSVELEMMLAVYPVTGDLGYVFRYMVIYDKQPNGLYPQIGDILAVNAGAPDFYSGINITNRDRFQVLRDKIVNVLRTEAVHSIKEFIPCRLQTQYGTNTGLMADITSGAVLVVGFTNLQTETGSGYGMIKLLNSRVRYFD